jgi:putative spermidine/putrescine transport system ATP-binding protein
MRAFITGLQRRLGITTLFVTHDQVEAIELADHIGVMFDGDLVQFGTPEEVFNRPRNLRVASFMGATNTLSGTLRETGGDTSAFEAGGARLAVQRYPHHRAGASATATVRPEHVDLAVNGAAPSNGFHARIVEAVYFGGLVSYKVEGEGLTLQVSDRSTRRFAPGDEVAVSIAPQHLWVFPE